MTKPTYQSHTPTIECHRMGALRGGMNWGCCAIEVVQNFNSDPDAAAVQALWVGDSPDRPVTGNNSSALYLGPTNKDIFLNRLRIGTFNMRDQPNHIFLASISGSQMRQGNTKKWLEILKAEGFIFLGGCSNSVYSGSAVSSDPNVKAKNRSPVYLFGLFRNIGEARLDDPFAPPKEWVEIAEPTTTQLERWLAGKTTFYTPTKEELEQLDKYEVNRRNKIGLKPKNSGNESAVSTPAEISSAAA